MSAESVRPILVSKKNAAVLLGISLSSINALLAANVLPSVKLGRRRLIRYTVLEKLARKGSRCMKSTKRRRRRA
jgi:excisionase family DNA binding protein